MRQKVLIIEDELSLQNILSAYFKREEFDVVTASDGLEGLEKFENENINIACIDVMMPKINGWEVVKSIRQKSNIPIIMMTALSEEEDQLKGFELEVDDYVTKPFSPAILVAKAKNLLKRYSNKLGPDTTFIENLGIIEINDKAHIVKVNKQEIDLSKTEYDMLVYFIKNAGIALNRTLILDSVWGIDAFVEERVVDTFVKTLRKKLGPASKYIKTVFGYGYKFDLDD